MRRLRESKPVELELDGCDDGVACLVSSITGAVATLSRTGALPPCVSETLSCGALGYLVFDHQGAVIALRGAAIALSPEEPELESVVTDGPQIPERRTAERVPMAMTAHVTASSESDKHPATIATVTADVSLSGVLVERRPGLDAGPVFHIELLPGDGADPLRVDARRARTTDTHLGMQFTTISEGDRVRLAGLIHRYLHCGER